MAFGACSDSMTDRCMARLLLRRSAGGNWRPPGVEAQCLEPRGPALGVSSCLRGWSAQRCTSPGTPRPFSRGSPGGPGAPPPPPPPPPSGPPRGADGPGRCKRSPPRMLPPVPHSRDPRLDISQARQVLKDALRTHDAREIVRWLEEHTHELTRSRFFELMFSFGP